MDIEKWKKYPRYNYLISNYGRVYSLRSKRVLHTVTRRGGYKYLYLWHEGRRVGCFVHGLVAELFVGVRPKGLIVRHKDGDGSNNIYNNLHYGTHAQNYADRIDHGTDQFGEKNPNVKLNWQIVDLMREEYAKGILNQSEVGRLFNLRLSTSYKVLTHRSWRKK
jgi:hypothetical protein